MAGEAGILTRQGAVSDESRPLLLLGCAVLAVYALAVGYAQHWRMANDSANYVEQGRPLLRNLDGYYFLRLARERAEGRYAPVDALRGVRRPSPPPLLADATVLVQRVSGATWETVAYWMPAVLGVSLVAALMGAGGMLGNLWIGLVASFASFSAGFWMIRAGPGFFDTDCLNPALVLGAGLFLHGFVTTPGRGRWGWAAALVCDAVVLALWWEAWPSVLALVVVAYALTFPHPAHSFERGVKLTLAAAVTACAGFVALYVAGVVSSGPDVLVRVAEHVRLVLGREGAGFASVTRSVQELGGVDVRGMGAALMGSWGALVLAAAGCVVVLVQRPLFAVCLLPCAVLACGSAVSARFFIFATPVLALGYGVLAVRAASLFRMAQFAHVPGLREALFACGFVALLAPGLVRSATQWVPPALTAQDVALAESMRTHLPETAQVWNWWDSGYMVQYASGLMTMSDGGRTSPRLTFAVAYPLAVRQPRLAARWMRFVAARGEGVLDIADEVAGRAGRGVTLAERVLLDPAGAADVFRQRGLDWTPQARDLFFPKAPPVAVYLHRAMVDTAYWWERLGTRQARAARGFVIDRLPRHGLHIDRATGVARREGQGTLRVGHVVDVRAGRVDVARTPHPGPACVVYHDEGIVYFIRASLFDSVGFRLLYRPETVREWFTPLNVRPGRGGVWLVREERS